jgi:hypothetical protein
MLAVESTARDLRPASVGFVALAGGKPEPRSTVGGVAGDVDLLESL